jgi:hypothetical protein
MHKPNVIVKIHYFIVTKHTIIKMHKNSERKKIMYR